MDASILDLRYKTKSLLNALEKRERVNILYHGKIKGVIHPFQKKEKDLKVSHHEYFGSLNPNENHTGNDKGGEDLKSVEEVMNQLRGNRYDF